MMGKHLKIETSKKLLWTLVTAAVVLTVCVVLGTFKGCDVSNLTQVTLAVWGAVAADAGVYGWKAKNENRSKNAMKLVRELADKYGIDAAARFAEIVLKD